MTGLKAVFHVRESILILQVCELFVHRATKLPSQGCQARVYALLQGIDFFAAVAALRAAATASVAALQKRRRSAQTRARARRREARTTYARTAPARTVRSHYDVLGIPRDAGAADVRRAYRKKALATHPDKTNGESGAFLAVGEALRVLSDRGLREAYDAELEILLS